MKFKIHYDKQSDDDMRAIISNPGHLGWSALAILMHCMIDSSDFEQDLSFFYEGDAATAKTRAQKSFLNLIEQGFALWVYDYHPDRPGLRGQKTVHVFADAEKCQRFAAKIKRLAKSNKIHSYKYSSKFNGGSNG